MAPPVWSVGQVLAASDVNNWFVPLAAYKTSQATRTTLTKSIDSDLQVTLAANAFYEVRAGIIYQSPGGSGGFAFTWTVPSGVSGGYTAAFIQTGPAPGTYGFTWGATEIAATPDAGVYGISIEGMLSTSGSGGTFGLNWASSSGPSSLILGAGSELTLRRTG